MLVDQKVTIQHGEKGREVHVVNKFDHSVAAEVARMTEQEGGGRGSLGASKVEYRVMGFIPPEMWNYDPWLITAKRALMAGDNGEYTKYVQKFFEVHKEYAPLIPQKYY